MKILMVANGYPPNAVGGVETYSAELSGALARRGHAVKVFCRESNFSQADYKIITEQQDGIPITRLVNDYKQATFIQQTFSDPRLEKIFSDFIQTDRPDLIHFQHLIGLSARLPLIAAEHHIPTIITLHDFWPICHRVKLIDWQGRICPGPAFGVDCVVCTSMGSTKQQRSPIFESAVRLAKHILPARLRRSLRANVPGGEDLPTAWVASPQVFRERTALFLRAVLSARQVLAPSEYVRLELSKNGYPSERIQVLPLGIALRQVKERQKSSPDKLIFAAIGPLQPIKGMDIAIRAFSQVPGEGLRLKIYGRHDLYPREHVREVFELAKADPRVSLEGPFDPSERANIYNTFDVLIVPSPAPETFSLVAHEALTMGKPVVASRIGALADIIRDGINGYLFEPGNILQLTHLLKKFSNDPALIEQLDIPGPAVIYSPNEHACQVEAIYRQVLVE